MSGPVEGHQDNVGSHDITGLGTSATDADTAERPISVRGKRASFGSFEVECTRVVSLQHNYYAVLKVTKNTPHTEVRYNWSRLQRVLVQENDKNGEGGAACAVCDAAFATLKDPVKKALYDRYIWQTDAPEGMTYEQWESSLAGDETDIPKMVLRILDCPGGTGVTCCVFVPGLIVSILFTGLLWLIMMPLRLMWRGFQRCCQGPGNERWHSKVRLQETDKEDEDDLDSVKIGVEGALNTGEGMEVLEMERGREGLVRELNYIDGNSNAVGCNAMPSDASPGRSSPWGTH